MDFIVQGHYFSRLVTGILILFLSFSNTNSNRYLYVPALGRLAQIGDLYNARKDEFCDVSVFKSSRYQVPAIEIKYPKSTIEATTSNTFHDICELLSIDINTAASILSGWITINPLLSGAAGILKSTLENSSGVVGTLIYTHQRVEQTLPLLYEKLKNLYNIDILAHKEATHVVSSIKWGGSLSITFQDAAGAGVGAAATPAHEQENLRTLLNAEFLKLQSTGRKFENETFNFTTFVKSDITLPNIELSSTSNVRTLFNEFSNSLQKLNGGKGIQILYKLTPLAVIQEHLNVSNAPDTTVHDITVSALRHLVKIFQEISNSQQQLNALYADVSSKRNCILPQSLEKLEELHSGLSDYKDNLTETFKQTIFDVRNGTEPMSALYDLVEEYNEGNFSSKIIKLKQTELSDALTKFEFCKTIEKSEINVEYFGSRQDLLSIIYKNSEKNIYLFFTKTEFAKNDIINYTENLRFFMKTQQETNSTKLLIVDCDFSHDICTNISEPTIYEYKNNQVTSTNFKRTVYEERRNLQEQINELKNNLTILMNITEKSCQHLHDPCAKNRCQNGASCNPSEDLLTFTCTCRNGYTGAFCGCNRKAHSTGSLKVVTVTECGGLIKVPELPSKASFLLDYKSNLTDTKEEECLWTLDSTYRGNSDRLKVRVTLLCDGLIGSAETLSVLSWTFSGNEWMLSQTILSKRDPKYSSVGMDNKLFLHYVTTNDRQSGFLLRIDVLEVHAGFSGSNLVFKTAPENHHFGPYKMYDTFSMTIIPRETNSVTLTVNYLDSKKTGACQGVDVLHIYKIKSVRRSDTIAKLCGGLKNPVSYTSAHPIVILYCTNKSTNGRGFSISWK